MGYFRAILAKEEVSVRAFKLTTELIKKTFGNYAAWAYRRQLIKDLEISLVDEFEWT